MQTLKVNAQVGADGHLHVDVPTNLPQGAIKALLVFDDSLPLTTMTGHLTEKKTRQVYDFSDLAGKLNWQGDALTEQRKIRDEW